MPTPWTFNGADPYDPATPAMEQPLYCPGNNDDFARLYQSSYPRVMITLLGIVHGREAAEDCAQEAYTRAYRAWPRWKPEAPAEAWLHRIAMHVAISHRRKESLRHVSEVIRRLGRPGDGADPAAGSGADLFAALRRLPAKQAAVVVLRHHHGYSNRELAAALDIPESTVAARLATGKKRLQRLLGQSDTEIVTQGSPGVPSAEGSSNVAGQTS